MNKYFLILSLLLWKSASYAQNSIQEFLKLQLIPKTWAITKTSEIIKIDGRDDESAWQQTQVISDFEDIQGPNLPKPTYKTELKMLWDDTNLYIYAKLYDPHIWGDLKNHDDIVYHNNDFEIFLKPSLNQSEYYEIEVNPLNTIFDLMLTKPYRFGGKALTHWDVKNLQSAVYINGTINEPNDVDNYWSVEFSIPHQSLYAFGKPKTPQVNDYWQINFSRVQWQHDIQNKIYSRKQSNNKLLEEDNWVWSPIGLINMHYPERWGYIQFVEKSNQQQKTALPPSFEIKKLAWNLHYLQKLFFQNNKQYTSKLNKLPLYKDFIAPYESIYNIIISSNKDYKNYNIEIVNKNKPEQTIYIDNKGNIEMN